jgi:hypothetical protein
VLFGSAQFAPMTAADRAVQVALETRGKAGLEQLSNTVVKGIDAAKSVNGWEVRADVVSAGVLLPADGGRVEKSLAAVAGSSITLSVLTPGGLIVKPEGFHQGATITRAGTGPPTGHPGSRRTKRSIEVADPTNRRLHSTRPTRRTGIGETPRAGRNMGSVAERRYRATNSADVALRSGKGSHLANLAKQS